MIVANSVVSASYYAHDDMMSFRVLSAVKTLLVALLYVIVGVKIFLRVLIKSLYIQHECSIAVKSRNTLKKNSTFLSIFCRLVRCYAHLRCIKE